MELSKELDKITEEERQLLISMLDLMTINEEKIPNDLKDKLSSLYMMLRGKETIH